MKTYFRLLSFARPVEKYLIPYLGFTVISVLFNTLNLTLLAPLLYALFYNSKLTDYSSHLSSFHFTVKYFKELFYYYFYQVNDHFGKFGALEFVCAIIVISVFLSNVFSYLSVRVMEDLKVHTLQNLRVSLFDKVIQLHLAYFDNERKGNIMAKISSDVQVVQFAVTNTLQVIFKEPLQLIGYLVALFLMSTQLTILSFLVVPISGLIIGRIAKRLREPAKESQDLNGLMISYLDEAFSGIKVVKAFNAEEYIKHKFRDTNQRLSRVMRRMAKRIQLASPVSEFLGVFTVACIVLYGGYLVISKQSSLDASVFIAYIAIFSQVLNPIKTITGSFSNINQGIAAGERILELMDTKLEVTSKQDAVIASTFNSDITFTDVSFSYDEKRVLDNISFSIRKGSTVALVGPSGGGKTTVSNLIPRFYDVSEGSISIDGMDIRDLEIASLRNLMGTVNQESVLFNDSIFNNISFGRPDITSENVQGAAQIANAHNFIVETEHGYHTNIGDRGLKLSGGQKQRISIARAVLKNPPILILDEATSALDTESEKLVQDAINNLMKNRTTLVIAHRLSTIQNADCILVIDKGKIVEQGSHVELIALGGIYNKLIQMQQFY